MHQYKINVQVCICVLLFNDVPIIEMKANGSIIKIIQKQCTT